MVVTPVCDPRMNNLSKVSAVFSNINLPSINIAASFGGISTSFIILMSLLFPVLLDSLRCIKLIVGYVVPIPTFDTCAYSKIAEVPVGTSYNNCSPGWTGTATDKNLLTGAIAILSQR